VHYDFVEKQTTPIPGDKRRLLEAHLYAPEPPKITTA
jgi:hypothetical protein